MQDIPKEEAKKKIQIIKKKWIKIYPSIKNKLLIVNLMIISWVFLDSISNTIYVYTTNWIERLNKSIRKQC